MQLSKKLLIKPAKLFYKKSNALQFHLTFKIYYIHTIQKVYTQTLNVLF